MTANKACKSQIGIRYIRGSLVEIPSNIYPATKSAIEILNKFNVTFEKIEVHEFDEIDPEPDLIWLTHTPNDDLSEGRYLSVQPTSHDNDQGFYFSLTDALNYGGSVTHWSTSCSLFRVSEIIQELVTTDVESELFKIK